MGWDGVYNISVLAGVYTDANVPVYKSGHKSRLTSHTLQLSC